MPTAPINGIDVYYQRSGSGSPLLFLNGSGATLATARPILTAYAHDFDVAAHDQRGLGQTSIPPGPYTMADYAADAAGLAAHLGWARYRVAGVSFGGMVAQELAVTFPERIERLALLCTSPGGAGGSSYPLHTLADMSPDERMATRTTLLDTRFTPAWLAEHETDQMIVRFMQAVEPVKAPEVLRGERLQLEARSDHDVFDRLGRIMCPTLVASGRYDGIAPPANGEAIAGQILDAELRLYEGGHLFMLQDPQAMPDVIEFLKGP